jgi:hypothetical protein
VNEDRVLGYLIMPLLAALLGVLQWVVLRRQMGGSGWWAPATVGGLLVGIVAAESAVRSTGDSLGIDPYAGWPLQIFYAMLGLSLGLAQAPVLSRRVANCILWVLASVAGWVVLGLVMGKSIDRTLDIVALGAIPAAFTGLALLWLWRAEPTRESAQDNPVAL